MERGKIEEEGVMGGSNYERRREVCWAVQGLLASDPEAMGDVIAALVRGQQAAIETERQRASDADRAMLAAFALLDAKRLSDPVRDWLGQAIVGGAKGGSNVENAMRARFTNAEAQP